MLPRRKPPRSGIERAPKREWPKHRRFVSTFVCAAYKANACEGRIECAHYNGDDIPSADKGGMGLKAHDRWTWPSCSKHHAESHQIGAESFQKKYGINLKHICEQFQKVSPCRLDWR